MIEMSRDIDSLHSLSLVLGIHNLGIYSISIHYGQPGVGVTSRSSSGDWR